MGETEGKIGRGTRSDFWHYRHYSVSINGHLVFSPEYRGKVLLDEVAEAAEGIIGEICNNTVINTVLKMRCEEVKKR